MGAEVVNSMVLQTILTVSSMVAGILNTTGLPQPLLLDAIRHAETGHLSLDAARTAVSKKNAHGPYQFLQKNLHYMGYGMPANITLQQVQDPETARELARTYVTGYTKHHNFTTPIQKLAAFNMGPTDAARWIASGQNFDDLPTETKEYITRASQFLETQTDNSQEETQDMSPEEVQHMLKQIYANSHMPKARPDALDMNAPSQGGPILDPIVNPAAGPLPVLMNTADGQDVAYLPNPNMLPGHPILANTNAIPTKNVPVNSNNQQAVKSGVSTVDSNTRLAKALQYGQKGNRRDKTGMTVSGYQPMIDRNDMLIRAGLAGVGASNDGGLAALGAMGDEYGAMQDLNNAGLAAYQEAMSKNQKSATDTTGALVVNDAIARTLPMLDGWTTGIGSYLKYLPETDAAAVSAQLETVKANIGFDKLQAMREASPTGGALGQVSNQELTALQSVFGNLEQSQRADDLRYNLQLLQHVYNNIIHGPGNHPFQMPTYGTPQSGGSSNLNDADAIVGLTS